MGSDIDGTLGLRCNLHGYGAKPMGMELGGRWESRKAQSGERVLTILLDMLARSGLMLAMA